MTVQLRRSRAFYGFAVLLFICSCLLYILQLNLWSKLLYEILCWHNHGQITECRKHSDTGKFWFHSPDHKMTGSVKCPKWEKGFYQTKLFIVISISGLFFAFFLKRQLQSCQTSYWRVLSQRLGTMSTRSSWNYSSFIKRYPISVASFWQYVDRCFGFIIAITIVSLVVFLSTISV